MKAGFIYDANQSNLYRMIENQKTKLKHIRQLGNIYRERSLNVSKMQNQVEKQRLMRQRNQAIDKQRKMRQTKNQINFENSILRNKLLNIYVPKQHESNESFKNQDDTQYLFFSRQKSHKKTTQMSFGNPITYRPNYAKQEKQKQLNQTNSRIVVKLSTIKSDIMPKLKLKDFNKNHSYYKEMIQKKSPKRLSYLKRIIQRNAHQHHKFVFPSSKSFRQDTNHTYANPEQNMILY